MDETSKSSEGFEGVKTRLEEIANIVGNDDVPLDEALDLFEEAVALGMRVSSLLEEGVLADTASRQNDAGAEGQAEPSAQVAN